MKFLENLRSLSIPQQMMLLGAVFGVVIAMMVMVRGVMKEPMALLYSGLDPVHAGEIIDELDQRGVSYEIRGQAIFTGQSDRDAVRFALAREGLPKQNVQGYELLDDVNGFSVTSEMYNAAYWRAKEGELTRTIVAIPGVSSARVHIGASLRSGFSRSSAPNTASVTVSTARNLGQSQAEGIQYLVALAVSGLRPEDVVVIDPAKGIIAGPNVDRMEEPGIVAETQAGVLEHKIMRLLDARVGPGNARVSVSVDVNRQRQRISEVRFDPDSRVLRNRTTNDSSETSSGTSAGVTVASNLPQGEGAGGGNSTSEVKNSVESVSYEVNEVRTETEKLPGEIERISIAVLLNEQVLGVDRADVGATDLVDEITADFAQLIFSGAGLSSERGDTLTVELMPFQPLVEEELVAAPGMMSRLLERYLWAGMQALLLGLVVIVLGLGVVRPMLVRDADEESDLALAGATGAGVSAGAEGASAASVEGGAAAGSPLDTPDPSRDPFDYLKDYATEREDETAALLQDWLSEDRKVAVNE